MYYVDIGDLPRLLQMDLLAATWTFWTDWRPAWGLGRMRLAGSLGKGWRSSWEG